MKRLWLMRHAKSSWEQPTLEDRDRPLSRRGERAAEAMAEHLVAERVRPALVLCSAALRTRQTLATVLPALGEELEVRIELELYTFDPDALFDRLRSISDDVPSALVVGHNPATEELASTLAARGARLAAMRTKYPTAALATLDARVDSWKDLASSCAELVAFVSPRDLD